VRVHEELTASGAALSYAALTAFCRRHGIGYVPPTPAGQYDFAPGKELQHDTSPHEFELGGKKRRVQTASAVLCYSRMLFFQCYPTFRRFDCKVFLTDALRYLTAFAGWANQGPTTPQLMESWSDYARMFGGLYQGVYLGYAVSQFFANGGNQAYIIRLTDATITPTPGKAAPATLTLALQSSSSWTGNIVVEAATLGTPNPGVGPTTTASSSRT